MTRPQAMIKAKRLYGAKALIRAHDSISSPERRAEAKAEAEGIAREIEAIDARIAELIKASGIDVLQQQRYELRKRRERAVSNGHYRRFAVGVDIGIAFEIKGQGDTWEEAIDAAARRKEAGI